MEWHLRHRWMWSTYRVLLTIRSNHSRFRVMKILIQLMFLGTVAAATAYAPTVAYV